MELLEVECLPVFLYGLLTCPISNKQHRSLNFALNGRFREIFRTKSAEVVQNCMQIFNYFFFYQNVLQNVDINFLLIILHRIIFYAIYGKTVMHVNGIYYTSDDCLF